jgi:hypothetical protein
MSRTNDRNQSSVIGENLVGVLKSLVRSELYEREQAAASAALSRFHSRHGARWTEEEEDRLIKEFHLAIGIISLLHQRHEAGIFAKLDKIRNEGRLRYEKF